MCGKQFIVGDATACFLNYIEVESKEGNKGQFSQSLGPVTGSMVTG